MDDNTTPSSSKRRKTSSSGNDNSILCLAKMPHDHLTAIADYLPKTSRALFVVSLTAPSKSFRVSDWKGKLSEASKDIISSTISAPIPSPNKGAKAYNSAENELLTKFTIRKKALYLFIHEQQLWELKEHCLVYS